MKPSIAITLKYHHDHIEDSVVIFSCEKCLIYLVAEEKQYPAAFVKLEFEGVQCVRSARTDCSPAIGIYPKESGASFIVELTESKWPMEAHKSYVYAGSQIKPRGHHYIVTNHDIFHEILADSFNESLVQQGGNEYDFIKSQFVV
ncbi:hypothetical protein [Methylomonas methanica]|uniref:Uncharacterized protein n=1 Tax=Methylomonas methanica (strain DSM 25384 / MC09) TaxID=857087 RepID=G0A7B6_METMM|nr:hypothetical protein [Methylomonas methanica]AEF99409.1 hypothetical protein Metme_0972 [Methylomonas methanica MC09]